MSLINQMLKDLEKRKRSESPRFVLPSSLQSKNKRYGWFFLLLLAGGGFYFYKNPSLILFRRNIQATIQPLAGKITHQKAFIDLKDTAVQSDTLAQALALMQTVKPLKEEPKPVMMISPGLSEPVKPSAPPQLQPAEKKAMPPAEPLSSKAPPVYAPPRRPAWPLSVEPSATADDYHQGLKFYAAGQFNRAAEALEKCLKQDPDKKSARLLLIKSYIALGDWLQVSAQFKAQEKAPFDVDLEKLHVQALVKQGLNQETERVLNHALKFAGDDPDLRGLQAAFYQRQGRYAEAVEVYRRLTRDDPAQAKWWLGLAICLEGVEQFDEAIGAYLQVLNAGVASSKQVSAYAQSRILALKEGK